MSFVYSADYDHGKRPYAGYGIIQNQKEKGHALEVALHWFINERVEEEQWAAELAGLMEQFYKNPGQLFMLDHRWGGRVQKDWFACFGSELNDD